MKKEKLGINTKTFFIDLLYDIVGCSIYSASVQCLSAPNNLPPGGVTGIAVLINYLTNLPISIITFCINVPLMALAVLFLGRRFAFTTIKTVVVLSITLQIASYLPPFYNPDLMMISLFAGVLNGIGLGIIFLRGSTTGGTDILGKLIQKRYPHVQIGKIVLYIDGIILLTAALVYRSIGNALYALILAFVSSRLIDGMVYGRDEGRMFLVVSDFHDEIATAIHTEFERSATLLHGAGTYTKEEKEVLICAVNTSEFPGMKRLIYQIDPSAFVMALTTDEVLGEGFQPLYKEE